MTIIYTELAQPLLDYLSTVEADTTATSASLNNNLTLSADYLNDLQQILTANYGFDGYYFNIYGDFYEKHPTH
jgi:hypothetical protein